MDQKNRGFLRSGPNAENGQKLYVTAAYLAAMKEKRADSKNGEPDAKSMEGLYVSAGNDPTNPKHENRGYRCVGYDLSLHVTDRGPSNETCERQKNERV